MEKHNEYFPRSVHHPCVTLLEKLEELGMSNSEFAIKTGYTEKIIFAILKGESQVTPEIAIQFEKVLKIPAHFWLNNQRMYDEFVASKRAGILKSNVIINKPPHILPPGHIGGLRGIK